MPNRDDVTRWTDVPIDSPGREPAAPAAAPGADASPASADWLERQLPLSLEAYEKAALERALVETWGDASEAARLLGIGRSTFYRKAGKHGINVGELRSPAPTTPATARAAQPAEDVDAPADAGGVGASKTLG